MPAFNTNILEAKSGGKLTIRAVGTMEQLVINYNINRRHWHDNNNNITDPRAVPHDYQQAVSGIHRKA